jgi:hypothetical protein
MGILVPFPRSKQRRGTYFYYNRAAIGIACAAGKGHHHEDSMIDIVLHKRPRKKPPHHVPDPHHFNILPHAHLHD